MTKLARLLSLSGADLLFLAEAVFSTLAVQMGLAFLTPRRCLALTERPPLRRRAPAHVDVARLVWLVQVAGRHVPGASTCLRRALVLALVLRRRGVAARLRVGVARSGHGLLAHAWLETETGLNVGAARDGAEYSCLPRIAEATLLPAPGYRK